MTFRSADRCRVLSFLLLGTAILSPASEPAASAAEPPGVRTLTLVRHGEYDHRRGDKGGLVALGVAQARLLAARLRSETPLTSIRTSTMRRALETARVIAEDFPGLPLLSSPLLQECLPPTWREEAMKDTTPERAAACAARLDRVYEELVVPSPAGDEHLLVVAHGNVIRYFVTKILRADPRAWLEMSIANGSVTEIAVPHDGDVKLLSFGDAGHIPPRLRSRTAPGAPLDLEVPRKQKPR